MTHQEEHILNELALHNNLDGFAARLALNNEIDVQESIFLALEQSYHFNPKSPWSESLINELKAYARLHGRPESIWNNIEEYQNHIQGLIRELKTT